MPRLQLGPSEGKPQPLELLRVLLQQRLEVERPEPLELLLLSQLL